MVGYRLQSGCPLLYGGCLLLRVQHPLGVRSQTLASVGSRCHLRRDGCYLCSVRYGLYPDCDCIQCDRLDGAISRLAAHFNWGNPSCGCNVPARGNRHPEKILSDLLSDHFSLSPHLATMVAVLVRRVSQDPDLDHVLCADFEHRHHMDRAVSIQQHPKASEHHQGQHGLAP